MVQGRLAVLGRPARRKAKGKRQRAKGKRKVPCGLFLTRREATPPFCLLPFAFCPLPSERSEAAFLFARFPIRSWTSSPPRRQGRSLRFSHGSSRTPGTSCS